MQVNIVEGPAHMLEAMTFARPSQQMMQYVNQRNDAFMYRMQNDYGAAGLDFLKSAQIFQQDYENARGRALAEELALRTASELGNFAGMFTPYETISALQMATGHNTQYLMSNPVIFDLYQQGRVEAYPGQFVNYEGDRTGFQRNAYRAVVNGIGQSYYDPNFDQDGEEVWHMLSTDEEDFGEPFRQREQFNAIRAWGLQNLAVSKNIDPTSMDDFEIRPEV